MMNREQIKKDSESRMQKALHFLEEEFKQIRGGRASTGLVETVKVNYYGQPTPLNQIAQISTPDARMILIKPFDATAIKDIERAILTANLGMNPQQDGKVVRLVVPPLSEERRKQIGTQVKKLAEDARVSIRNIRGEAIKHLEQGKKDGAIPEDDAFKGKEDIQKLTDHFNAEISKVADHKTQEIMTV